MEVRVYFNSRTGNLTDVVFFLFTGYGGGGGGAQVVQILRHEGPSRDRRAGTLPVQLRVRPGDPKRARDRARQRGGDHRRGSQRRGRLPRGRFLRVFAQGPGRGRPGASVRRGFLLRSGPGARVHGAHVHVAGQALEGGEGTEQGGGAVSRRRVSQIVGAGDAGAGGAPLER